MSEEWSGWGPVSQPRNQTLSCLQTLMPLHFHPISMELQQYKTWHPICLHSPLCVWSVLVRVHTREAGGYIMCFLEGAVAQSSFMGEREREKKKKIGMKFEESESTFSEESTCEIWCRLIPSDSVHRMNLETLSSPCLPLQQDFITCVKGALNTHTGQHHQSRLCAAAEGTCAGLLCPLWC